MAFNKETKIKALVASARHCCVCHRFKGLNIEVHHIVPVAKKGLDDDENAIALCFDCHANAGHYNAKHPKGTKLSVEELKLARRKWHNAVLENRIDISKNEEWRSFQELGSSFQLHSGIVSTVAETNGCSSSWFSGDSTAILGSGEILGEPINSFIKASWKIRLTPYWREYFNKGFIVIGCLRYFGGLHSKEYGAQAEILFNNKPIDGFGLMIMPQNHTDYFHRIPLPRQLSEIDIWPLSACQTTYAWPIQKDNLEEGNLQTVTLKIDANVSWDIDYVAIVCHAG